MIIEIDKLVSQDQKSNSFSELFQSPDGYQIDKLLLTTFTMSKRILADIYMHYAAEKENVSMEGMSEIQKRIFLQKAFKDYSGNIDVYVQEDQILESISTRKLEGLDEFITGKISTLHKVQKPQKGFFHPKLLLISFTKEGSDHHKYRLYVSSKNLTYDNFYQTGILLKGEKGEVDPSGEEKNGKQLSDFICHFSQAGVKKANCPQLAEEIKDVNFYHEKEGDVTLLFFIPNDQNGECNNKNRKMLQDDFRGAEVSLFFTDSVQQDFFEYIFEKNVPDTCSVVSNGRSWVNAIPEGTKIPKYSCVLDQSDKASYIHSKMYFAWKKGKMIYYAGSANCTGSALKNNYEMMVRVETPWETKEETEFKFDKIKNEEAELTWHSLDGQELAKAKETEKVLSYIKSMSAKCIISKNDKGTLSMEYVLANNKTQEQLEKIGIERLILCLPNDHHRYEITFDDHNEFKMSWNNVRMTRIPFEKKALIFVVLNKNLNGKNLTADIKIDLIMPKGLMGQNNDQEEDIWGQNLFKGHLPAVREAVPAVSREYKGFYHEKDTDDIRIAKYFAYCNAKGITTDEACKLICDNCENLLEKCSDYAEDGEEDEEFEDYFDAEDFNKELEVAKKKIQKLKDSLKDSFEEKSNG